MDAALDWTYRKLPFPACDRFGRFERDLGGVESGELASRREPAGRQTSRRRAEDAV